MNIENSYRRNMIVIMAIYFATNVIFIINPPMQGFATELYPDLPYNTVLLISSVSNLMAIPGSLISAAIIGKKISFRTAVLISLGGVAAAGCLPYLIRGFHAVIGLRAVVGFCMGMILPLESTLAIRLFDEKRRASALGIGSLFMSFGGIAMQVISGAVCTISAAYSWLVHGIVIIPLIIVLALLREPEKTEKTDIHRETKNGKSPMPIMVFISAICFMILFAAFYPILLNMSAIMASENIGTSATSGIISALYTVGGMLAGVLFGRLRKTAGRFTTPIGLALWIIGAGIFATAHNVPLMAVSSLILGAGVFIVWPSTIYDYSEYVPDEKQSLASAIFTSGMTFGCFLAGYFITLVGNVSGNTDPRLPVKVGFFVVLVIGIIWSLLAIKGKAKSA